MDQIVTHSSSDAMLSLIGRTALSFWMLVRFAAIIDAESFESLKADLAQPGAAKAMWHALAASTLSLAQTEPMFLETERVWREKGLEGRMRYSHPKITSVSKLENPEAESSPVYEVSGYMYILTQRDNSVRGGRWTWKSRIALVDDNTVIVKSLGIDIESSLNNTR